MNPSRPRHSVLSLLSHRRRAYYHNLDLKELLSFSRRLNDAFKAFLAALCEYDPPPTRENSLLIPNSFKSWQKSKLFFDWIKAQSLFRLQCSHEVAAAG